MALSARRYSPVASLYPQASLLDGQGNTDEALRFQQLAPGFFAAQWMADPSTELRVNARSLDIGGAPPPRGETRLVSMAGADVANEYQVDPQLSLNLQALATATAGNSIDPTQPQTDDFNATLQAGMGSLRLYSLWWYALLLGLLLYLTELVYRRWPRT